MFLRFENDIAVYSFNESETNKLKELIIELNKIHTSTDFYEATRKYYNDQQLVRVVDVIMNIYVFNSNIKIDTPLKQDIEYAHKRIIESFIDALDEYRSKKSDIPWYIKEELKKYSFGDKCRSVNPNIIIAKKYPGSIVKFTIPKSVYLSKCKNQKFIPVFG